MNFSQGFPLWFWLDLLGDRLKDGVFDGYWFDGRIRVYGWFGLKEFDRLKHLGLRKKHQILHSFTLDLTHQLDWELVDCVWFTHLTIKLLREQMNHQRRKDFLIKMMIKFRSETKQSLKGKTSQLRTWAPTEHKKSCMSTEGKEKSGLGGGFPKCPLWSCQNPYSSEVLKASF